MSFSMIRRLSRVSPGLHHHIRYASANATNYIDPLGHVIPYTTNLTVLKPSEQRIPCYRVLDLQGKVLPEATLPEIAPSTLVSIHKTMLSVRIMDNILYEAQRQGRVPFYMTSIGEEGAVVGSASALNNKDPIFSQYREQGAILYRGFSIFQFTHQCFGNIRDLGKGRQMPMHVGSKDHAFHFVSSPLATQIPHAVGSAYGIKRENMELNDVDQKLCSVTYFGDGAASEGDFHAAMNFAATLEVPILFICRNNGFAISTPVHDQFRGDGIISRAAGYGMTAMRVDGNDPIAVHHAVKQAREYAVVNSRPVLVECMTYRVGHHSTSDDSTRYRSLDEINNFKNLNCPINRLQGYLTENNLWSREQHEELHSQVRQEVLQAMRLAEAEAKPALRELFTDVYAKEEPHIKEQRTELREHLAKYKQQYESSLRAKKIEMDIDLN